MTTTNLPYLIKKNLIDLCEAVTVLQASPMGKNVYTRMGFAEHSQIQHWELGK